MQLRVFRFYMAHASTARREWAASHVTHNIYYNVEKLLVHGSKKYHKCVIKCDFAWHLVIFQKVATTL